MLPLQLVCQIGHAAPTGGEVVAGQAAIAQVGNITDINQASQNAVINWQQFNVKPSETVNFKQPNAQAVTLNRVIGNERSVIDGAINANGKVFIQNEQGTLIGKNAQINVGSLVATTAHINDDAFMNGNYDFYHNGNPQGAIENLGQITVPKGGMVALVAPIVKNGGTIKAPQGNALLGSAESFSITLPDNANFSYTLNQGTLQGLVDNGGAILADGGRVVLTAKGVDTVKKSVIRHTGVIEANTVSNKNGVIELLGDLDNTALNVSGTLKAEAKGSGDGGFIETSASQVKIEDSAEVSTKADNGKTGTWLIDPNDIIIAKEAGKKPDGTAYTKDEITATGKKIEESLAKTGIIIESTKGKSNGKGDVIIDDEISWNANPLKLVAQNDIHINKTLNGTGTASLALEYGQATSDGNDSNYYLDKNTPVQHRKVKINLPAGQNFSTKKGKNGETFVFDVIHQMPKIVKNAEGDWESKFTTRNIAFGRDIDVSHTKDYEGFASWRLPKEENSYDEWGRVHGLGHVVDGLYIRGKKDRQYAGLFQKNYRYNNTQQITRDIGVTNVDIRTQGYIAYAGGLVGSGSDVHNSYATGSVSIQGNYANAGGLVGWGHNIHNSYANNDVVRATGKESAVGGVVGYYWLADDSKNSFFNSTKQPSLSVIGEYDSKVDKSKIVNVVGKTEAELKTKATFKDWDFEKVWYMNAGEMPHLQAHKQGTIVITPTNPAKSDLAINAHDLKKTYDGKAVATENDLKAIAKANGYDDIVAVTGLKDGDTLDSLGKISYDGTWKGAKDAGKYSIVPTGLTGGQKYEIKYGEGSLTVNKRPISIVGSKVYDGTNAAAAREFVKNASEKGKVTLLGVYDQDDVKVHISGTSLGSSQIVGSNIGTNNLINLRPTILDFGYLAGKDVGTHNLVDIGSLKLDGKDSGNYELTLDGSYWTISKAPLKIKALNNFVDINKDGLSILDGAMRDNIGIVSKGLVNGETIDISKLKIKISKDDNSDTRLWHDYNATPLLNSVVVNGGKIENYDVSIENGKIITLPKDKNSHYDFPNNDKDSKRVNKLIDYADSLEAVKDELIASEVVYNDDFGKSELKKLNDLDITDLVLIDSKHGFGDLQMAIYQKGKSDTYIIAYRGSEGLKDHLISNLPSIVGRPVPYQDSRKITSDWINKTKLKNPNPTFIFTGHSLGGSLAQYNAAFEGKNQKVVTFNSAPMRTALLYDIERNGHCKDLDLCTTNTVNFKFDNDLLRHIEPLDVAKNRKLFGQVKDLYTFTVGSFGDHLEDHINDIYKTSQSIKENNLAIKNYDKTERFSNFSHLDLSAILPIERLISGSVGVGHVFVQGGEVINNVVRTSVDMVGDAATDMAANLGKIIHDKFVDDKSEDELLSLNTKHYNDSNDSITHLIQQLKFHIMNDRYDDFPNSTVRATDHFRMLYIAYELNTFNEKETKHYFSAIKNNYLQALHERYNNETDIAEKFAIKIEIEVWKSRTFEVWQKQKGQFILAK